MSASKLVKKSIFCAIILFSINSITFVNSQAKTIRLDYLDNRNYGSTEIANNQQKTLQVKPQFILRSRNSDNYNPKTNSITINEYNLYQNTSQLVQQIQPKKTVKINLDLGNLAISNNNQKELLKVNYIVDGDTIDVERYGRIRAIGIDTPETKSKSVECYGNEATMNANKKLASSKVYLEFDGELKKDKYGRTLAYIYREDGYFYNLNAIRDGYAHSYKNYSHTKMSEFNNTERQAKNFGKGLWNENTCNGNTKTRKSIINYQTHSFNISQGISYRNCDDAIAKGKAPLYRGEPGYEAKLDRDGDGVACEPYRR